MLCTGFDGGTLASPFHASHTEQYVTDYSSLHYIISVVTTLRPPMLCAFSFRLLLLLVMQLSRADLARQHDSTTRADWLAPALWGSALLAGRLGREDERK